MAFNSSANYGGRILDNQQGIKQFYVAAPSQVIWNYKRLPNGLVVETPANDKNPVLINNDLIVTGSLYNTSDERLKENIVEIETKKIDEILTLNPIHFSYKNDPKNKLHYGVLAQDVEKIYPELVEENNFGYKTVNYQELIPIMLAKIMSMQKEIDELKINKK